MDDNTSMRTPVLDNHPYHGFKPLKTIWIVFFLIFVMLFVEFVALTLVFVWTDSKVRCDLFFLIVYTLVSLWTVNFIVRFYINWRHKICLMAKGYFEFYDISSRYIEIPFYISCVWLCFLTVVICLYIEFDTSMSPKEFFCGTTDLYSPIIVVTIALSLQNVLLIPLYAVYIMKVYEFNKRQCPPDSENGNEWMPASLRDTFASGDLGYRERCEVIDKMLEKQADLIRYYKEANEFLNKKVFDLTSQGRAALENN